MQVAICQIEFRLFETHSLKDKRSVVRSLKDRIKQKFNVSIAEVAQNDDHRSGCFGIAIVSNDRRHLERVFTNIVNLVSADGRIEIIKQIFELG